MKPSEIIKTKIVKSFNGHTVRIIIGHQSFDLQEKEAEPGMTSYKYAKWYQDCLKAAFKNLDKLTGHLQGEGK